MFTLSWGNRKGVGLEGKQGNGSIRKIGSWFVYFCFRVLFPPYNGRGGPPPLAYGNVGDEWGVNTTCIPGSDTRDVKEKPPLSHETSVFPRCCLYSLDWIGAM